MDSSIITCSVASNNWSPGVSVWFVSPKTVHAWLMRKHLFCCSILVKLALVTHRYFTSWRQALSTCVPPPFFGICVGEWIDSAGRKTRYPHLAVRPSTALTSCCRDFSSYIRVRTNALTNIHIQLSASRYSTPIAGLRSSGLYFQRFRCRFQVPLLCWLFSEYWCSAQLSSFIRCFPQNHWSFDFLIFSGSRYQKRMHFTQIETKTLEYPGISWKRNAPRFSQITTFIFFKIEIQY